MQRQWGSAANECAVSPARVSAELSCGADVEIHSLEQKPELNGVRGKVVEPQDPGSGRWGVKIDSDGRVLALKPANLAIFEVLRTRALAHCIE